MTRLEQRHANFRKALNRLAGAVNLSKRKELDEYERDSMVKRFEFTFECAWRVMKSYAEYQGDCKPASDIDITLKGRDLTLRDVAMLDDKLYYSHLPYFFDISLFSTITNTELLANIRCDGKVLYRKKDNAANN